MRKFQQNGEKESTCIPTMIKNQNIFQPPWCPYKLMLHQPRTDDTGVEGGKGIMEQRCFWVEMEGSMWVNGRTRTRSTSVWT